MAADHSPNQSLVAQMIQAAFLTVTLAGGVNQGQIAGPISFKKVVFQGNRQMLGETDADETAGDNSVTVPDQSNRFVSGDDLAFAGERLRRQQGMWVRSRHAIGPICNGWFSGFPDRVDRSVRGVQVRC